MKKYLILILVAFFLSCAYVYAQPPMFTKETTLIDDTSPQLGGDLDLNTHEITVKDVDSIPIGYGIDGTSAPDAKATLTSTNMVDIRTFAHDTDEDLRFVWEAPFDLTGTTIAFRVITWIHNATGPSSEGWSFFLQGASMGDGDVLSSALGTAIESAAASQTHVQYDRVATTWSAAVTIINLTAGETCLLKLYRDVSDGDDTYAQLIGCSMLQIKYSRKLTND